MTDKVQIIREKVEKLKKLADAMYYAAQHLTTDASQLHKVMDEYHKFIIDSMQEKPKKCMYSKDDYTDEDRKVLCDGCEEDCEYNKKGTVNDKLGGINNALVQDSLITSKPIGVPADVIELVSIPDKKEPVSEDLEEEINRYIGYPQEVDEDVSTTMIRKAARHFAKWQKQQTISKACEWLNKNFTFIHPRKGVPVCAVNLNSFKDALNDEEV